MRALVTTIWTLVPTSDPCLELPCPRCDTVRSFVCAGRFRVNAQKRRLDVWLLFHCGVCSHTARREVHERVRVAALPAEQLEAFHRNDPTLARHVAIQLGARCGFEVHGDVPEGSFVAHLRSVAGVDARLDRVVARALSISRAEVRERRNRGALQVVPPDRRAWSRRVRDGQSVLVRQGERPAASAANL